jgi:hypothetical protein
MTDTISLNIPDASTRARQSVIRHILRGLIEHELNLDEAARAIERLIKADKALNTSAQPIKE